MSDEELEQRFSEISDHIRRAGNNQRIPWWKSVALALAITTAVVTPVLMVTWSGGERAAQLDAVRESVQDVKVQIDGLRKETKAGMQELRQETRSEIRELRQALRR